MPDTNYSLSTSANVPRDVQDSLSNNKDHDLLEKPYSDFPDQYAITQSTREECQQTMENTINPSVRHGQKESVESVKFSGDKDENAGEWLDHVFEVIEQQELTSTEQRDVAAGRLTGEALLWYRLNRLSTPDMQTFTNQFLLVYNSSQTTTCTNSVTAKDVRYTYTLAEAAIMEKELEQTDSDTAKSSMEENRYFQSTSQSVNPRQVLQSARNEKVKLFPNFSGSENSLNWLKSLQQIGKSLKLNDQEIYELATIKLSGPAQEWFYHQNDEINDWSSFKQVFLHAFPPPIQPTSIDYLAQLLARKQGESEPVGKFIQDINRLCLKLDNKISEKDKLQYLRRGLRSQLQHYALSITSLQDFLTVMQRHEQIEKETIANEQLSPSFKSSVRSNQQQQISFNRPKQNYYNYQANQFSTRHASNERYPHQNSYSEPIAPRVDNGVIICYQCNKPGHFQRDCPDVNSSQQHQQHFQQRSH